MLDSDEKEPKVSAHDKRHEEIELLKTQMLSMVPEDQKDIFFEKLEQILMLNVQNHIPMS